MNFKAIFMPGFFLAMVSLSVSASILAARSQTPQPQTAVWQALIFDRTPGTDVLFTPSSKNKNAGMYHNNVNSQMRTIVTDGKSVKRLPYCLIKYDGRLAKLITHTTKSTVSCRDGSFKTTFSCERLWAEPVDGSAKKVLLNSCFAEDPQSTPIRAGRHYLSRKECAQLKKVESQDADDDEFYNFYYAVLGVYNNLISIDNWQTTHARGGDRPAPWHQWATYTLQGKNLVKAKIALPDEVYDEGQTMMSAIPKEEAGDFADQNGDIRLQEKEFAIIPFHGAAAAEVHSGMANAISFDELYAKVKLAKLPATKDIYDSSAFARSHPHLLPWTKADFYSLSPDKKAIVYCINHNLYWLTMGGKAKRLTSLTDGRGIQWYNGPAY